MDKDTKQEGSSTKLSKANLTVYRVFSNRYTVLGIPLEYFSVGVAVSVVNFFTLFWLTGIFFFIVYTYGMYKIHEKDPSGFQVWRKAFLFLRGNKRRIWLASKYKTTTVYKI